MSGLLEKYPIGSRWVDADRPDSDIRTVVGHADGLVFVVYNTPGQSDWRHPTGFRHACDSWKPYVEPTPLPEFKHWGWAHPTTMSVRSGYVDGPYPSLTDGCRWFEYGTEDGELYIRWMAAE